MSLTFDKQKFKNLKRISRFLVVISLLLVFVPAAFANTGAIHLSSAYDYRSLTYNTYVKWAGDLYGDSISYGLGSDSHVNFTNFSMGSTSNPSWTFGVVSQDGNVTISAIQTNYIRFSAVTKTSETLNLTIYYISLPTEVDVAQPTNTSIPSSGYYTTYSAWVAAAAPAVYNDAGSNYLMVKSTYSTPVIQIIQSTAATFSSYSTSSSAATTTAASVSSTSSSSSSTATVAPISSSSLSSLFALVLVMGVVIGVVLVVGVNQISRKRRASPESRRPRKP
jgi:hypothetical protein